jgi:hypothetical protein
MGGSWVDHGWSTLSLESFARKRIRRRATFKQDREAISAFINELKILQKVSHHNLVEFVGSYTDTLCCNHYATCCEDGFEGVLRLTPFSRENNHQLRKFFGCLAVGAFDICIVRTSDTKISNLPMSSSRKPVIS